MKGYLSIRETSYKWGVSERRVNQYVTEGRIPGVERFGRSWAIPEEAVKPEDPRRDKARKKEADGHAHA
jgi:predicted site-specific integrase-resolvase